jgi:hypothetical protein
MKRLTPSPAMVVALIALFVSLGGVSYGVATGSITGKAIKNSSVGTKDLKNNDIRSGDIRNNSLTGSDVNESKLGKVPSAGSADSATSAANASQLGGAAPSAYLKGADVLHATVDTTATGATLVRGRGVVSVDRIDVGFYAVRFDRDVSKCTWTASGGSSTTGPPAYIATPRGISYLPPTYVGVIVWNASTAGVPQADGASFFLNVTC